MDVCDYVVDYLKGIGVMHGFYLTGGTIAWMADACSRNGLRLYTTHHEQAAAFAAIAEAAATKNMGLAMATSGPGATNMITGICSAFFGSYPVLFLTGQVNTAESNLTGKRRQVGFQETDIVSIVKPVTKYAVHVKDANMICYELEKAVFIAKNKRMGPVLLDVPIEVEKADIDVGKVKHFIGSPEHMKLAQKPKVKNAVLEQVAKVLKDSKRPVILIGHGVKLAGAEENALKLIQLTNIPFVTSLLGTDSVPTEHKLCFGFIGTYGERFSNFALANADLILVLGARLDSRQVGVQKDKFAPEAKVIHIDIDPAELGKSVREWVSIESDLNDFLEGILPYVKKQAKRGEWINYLESLKSKYKKLPQKLGAEGIDPIDVVRMLAERHNEGDVIAVDVGSNEMWFTKGWISKRKQLILIDGGMAPMGYSLPAAVGASLTMNKCPVLVVTGDGGLQVNIHELQTVVRNRLPIKIVVLNNNALGMSHQFQVENFDGREIGVVPGGGYDTPDFAKVAKAYGLEAESVERRSDLKKSVDWITSRRGAALLDVKIPITYWTLPKSRYNRPVHDMHPFLERSEYKEALKYVKKILQ